MKVLDDVITLIKADIKLYEDKIERLELPPKYRTYHPADNAFDDYIDRSDEYARENYAIKCHNLNNIIFGLKRALGIVEKFQKDVLESENNWKSIDNKE